MDEVKNTFKGILEPNTGGFGVPKRLLKLKPAVIDSVYDSLLGFDNPVFVSPCDKEKVDADKVKSLLYLMSDLKSIGRNLITLDKSSKSNFSNNGNKNVDSEKVGVQKHVSVKFSYVLDDSDKSKNQNFVLDLYSVLYKKAVYVGASLCDYTDFEKYDAVKGRKISRSRAFDNIKNGVRYKLFNLNRSTINAYVNKLLVDFYLSVNTGNCIEGLKTDFPLDIVTYESKTDRKIRKMTKKSSVEAKKSFEEVKEILKPEIVIKTKSK
jgi:hypothetical protein